MKKILIPTDFSENAWSATLYALKLYAKENCTFYFINSCKSETSRVSSLSSKLSRVMKESATKELTALKKLAKETDNNDKHSFETILSTISLLDAVNRTIQSHEIDLVVMGTKGASKAKEIFFGSNTVNVMQNIKSCPVLAVPDKYNFISPKQIAFPTDYNKQYADNILNPIKNISRLHNSKIRVLHIEEEKELTGLQSANIKKLDEALTDFEHSYHWVANYTEKSSAIINFIEALDINILVMINNKHSFIESIINEPVVKKIGFQPIIPFLVINE